MAQEITVHGMSCEGCETTVEEALAAVDGVSEVRVNRETDSATIDGTAESDELIMAIEDAGYDATIED